MKILDVVQGSDEWKAARAKYRTASEAPAMMGASKYMTRSDLLKQKATGQEPEIDASTQYRFNLGHDAEAAARPLVEALIGDDLYPATAVDDDGYLLASFDGIAMSEAIAFEHKLWNEGLAAQVRAGELEPHYYWQLEQQLAVSGAAKVVFVTSDGTAERFAFMEYRPVTGRRDALMAGWRQFDADLAAYSSVEDAPAAVGRSPENLPALLIEVTGMVTNSNLVAFKSHAMEVFAGIKTALQTDEDFADAEKAVKWCGEVESRLESAKQHALSQTASIDELFRTIDAIKAEARTKRLELDKLVKSRKEMIRADKVAAAQRKLQSHIAELNSGIGKPYMPTITADFAGAIKGLKTISSLRNAVDTELARAKIQASETADRIQKNLAVLVELAPGLERLFPDVPQLAQKAPEDFSAIVRNRVAEHLAAEKKRLQEAEADRLSRENAAAAEAAKALVPLVFNRIDAAQTSGTISADLSEGLRQTAASFAADIAINAARSGQTIKLGELSDRLGFTVTADFLARLGFPPHSTERSAKLYLVANFAPICAALVRHIQAVAGSEQRAA